MQYISTNIRHQFLRIHMVVPACLWCIQCRFQVRFPGHNTIFHRCMVFPLIQISISLKYILHPVVQLHPVHMLAPSTRTFAIIIHVACHPQYLHPLLHLRWMLEQKDAARVLAPADINVRYARSFSQHPAILHGTHVFTRGWKITFVRSKAVMPDSPDRTTVCNTTKHTLMARNQGGGRSRRGVYDRGLISWSAWWYESFWISLNPL